MKTEEYMSRIMGSQINLDPETTTLELNTIVLHLSKYPTQNRLYKLRNLLITNTEVYKNSNKLPKDTLAVFIETEDGQDVFVVGDIYLDMDIYQSMKVAFIGYSPLLFRYDGKENGEILKESLISTIRIDQGVDNYGLN